MRFLIHKLKAQTRNTFPPNRAVYTSGNTQREITKPRWTTLNTIVYREI